MLRAVVSDGIVKSASGSAGLLIGSESRRLTQRRVQIFVAESRQSSEVIFGEEPRSKFSRFLTKCNAGDRPRAQPTAARILR
jgi:hypothetical protein